MMMISGAAISCIAMLRKRKDFQLAQSICICRPGDDPRLIVPVLLYIAMAPKESMWPALTIEVNGHAPRP